MNPVEYPTWAWLLFFGIILGALALDLGVANRKAHIPTRRETFFWSSVWISLALGFNAFIFWQFGINKAKEFFTGYLIELSLSVDNLFVFLLIFSYFKVPKKSQHRVLFWGIMGAMVLRMIMIFVGAELVERFHWIIYLFGAFLVYTGLSMFKSEEDEHFEPHESAIVKFTTRFIRISKHYEGEKFSTVVDGVRTGTLLLMVLIVVEFTDLIFAVDSIPAIFGITTDRYIVYTSNIFAILGLRTFFFLLADMAEKFHYLKYGLAFILTFIGVKMLLPLLAEGLIMVVGKDSNSSLGHILHGLAHKEFDQIIINVSLSTVVLALLVSIVLSLLFPKHENKEPKESEAAEG